MEKICAIIPAYNEEPRISAVMDVVTEVQYLHKIIVVDDGSDDETGKVAERYPVQVIRHDKNLGKGAALETGLRETGDADYYLFLDADLINLREEHLSTLLNPLRENNKVSMSIGLFQGSQMHVHLAQNIFSILNGQRAISYELARKLPDLTWARFGVEILLTRYAQMIGEGIEWVPLYNITHWTKEQKFGFVHGFQYRLQMYHECLKCLATYKRRLSPILESRESK